MSNKKTPKATYPMTLHVRDTCLCLHVQRAARALARRFDEELKPLDLKSGQFSLLISLNRPHAPTLGSVADLLAMDRTTLTANLKPLERRGLIEVRQDDKDRRARRLHLTAGGLALLERALPIWEETHDWLEKAMASDPDVLRAGLASLSSGRR